jgi:hypothetical protein
MAWLTQHLKFINPYKKPFNEFVPISVTSCGNNVIHLNFCCLEPFLAMGTLILCLVPLAFNGL